MAIVAVVLFVVSALAGGRAGPFADLPGVGYEIVRIPSGFGVIVDEAYLGRSFDFGNDGPDGGWTPTATDVLRAEELIRALRPIDTAPAPDGDIEEAVSRQYFGLMEDGTRLIYVNAAFSRGLPSDPTRLIVVLDGGPAFWRATINADTWTLESYIENGEA